MGFGPAIAMVLAGTAAAVALIVLAVRRNAAAGSRGARSRPTRDSIEASIIADVLVCGGMSLRDAREFLKSDLDVSALVIGDIDLQNWAEEYGRRYGEAASHELLGQAVKAAVMTSAIVSLPQYNALLDLCFGLGLQTDSLARLRARYRFAYVDYAKANRPRSADRAPRRPASRVDTDEMMKLLEIDGVATRQQVISAYRRLAAQCHPDRFHDATDEEKRAAADKFIRLTEAYERMLTISGED